MSGVVGLLNRPEIKQDIKLALGCFTFTLVVGNFIFEAIEASRKSIERNSNESTADKFIVGCARMSVGLAAAVTPLGVCGVSFVASRIFAADRFGPNTTFASNWKHPRHIASLAAAGLAIPIVVRRCFGPLTNEWSNIVYRLACFTLVTGRPALHLANLLAQKVLRSFR